MGLAYFELGNFHERSLCKISKNIVAQSYMELDVPHDSNQRLILVKMAPKKGIL